MEVAAARTQRHLSVVKLTVCGSILAIACIRAYAIAFQLYCMLIELEPVLMQLSEAQSR